MDSLFHYFALSAPLFGMVLGGYVIARVPGWRATWTRAANWFVFTIALPALLFRMMSDFSALPPVDMKLLFAFFGGCLIVFAIGRLIAARVFALDGSAQSVFALGGIFSSNVLLGVPLAKSALGDAAMPAVALVLVFNALILWTLVTVSVEWARNGALSLRGFGRTARSVLTNPVVASIVGGSLFGLSRLHLPHAVDAVLAAVGKLAGPAALIALGMGLVQFGVRQGLRQGIAICALKLLLQPLVVLLLALALGLPTIERDAVVLLASLSVGANVYLMAVQFETLQSAVASSLVLSTALAAFTTPLLLSMLHALRQ